MMRAIPEVEEILTKYEKEEEKIAKTLSDIECRKAHNQEPPFNGDTNDCRLSYEEAKGRNKALLDELDVVKGNLRSKAIFSPTEMEWEKISKKYQETPALPVTTWRCNLPVFV